MIHSLYAVFADEKYVYGKFANGIFTDVRQYTRGIIRLKEINLFPVHICGTYVTAVSVKIEN
jgi:hypothetical protein